MSERESEYESAESEDQFDNEDEGVNVQVKCADLNFPPVPVKPNFKILEDDSLWSDLEPISACSEPLFEINHDLLVVRCQSLLLSLLKKKEFSVRGHELARIVIKLNPADYSAWYYLTQCLSELKVDYNNELWFSRRMTFESIKAYQPWNYRRCLCKLLKRPFDEIDYVKLEIYTSPKNQCAWTYLTWLINEFDTDDLPKEFEFVDFLVSSDRFNNSVWNYKIFLIKKYKNRLGNDFIIGQFVGDLQRMLDTPDNEGLCSYLIDMAQFVESFHRDCIASVSPDLLNDINQSCKIGCLTHNYKCRGPPSLCLALAVKSASPTSQLYRVLKTYKITQVRDELCVMDPMMSDYYLSL